MGEAMEVMDRDGEVLRLGWVVVMDAGRVGVGAGDREIWWRCFMFYVLERKERETWFFYKV